MNAEEVLKLIEKGETATVEFKSWEKAKNFKDRIELALPEIIAMANSSGGQLFFGVEDVTGEISGCKNYDVQNIIESIYDKTVPHLFVEAETVEIAGKIIIVISVKNDNVIYATSDGRCYKRLGKNSKPYYPQELSQRYDAWQNDDFSKRIISKSTIEDIDLLEVYKLKERIGIRDSASTLTDMNAIPFLHDLGLLVNDGDIERLTVAGLLFVGKETSLKKLLPQHEVIYLHYSDGNSEEYDARLDMKQPIITILDRLTEKIQDKNTIINIQVGLYRLEVVDFAEKVFQEALLNALTHRDYQSQGAIYVRHYPDKLIIENPGGFIGGVTPNNIITHPSVPRNKLVAETLQQLKYVQRAGQGVDLIYRETLSMGKEYPNFSDAGDSVRLTIEGTLQDPDFVKFLSITQDEMNKLFSLNEIMVLRYLLDNSKIMLKKGMEITQSSENEVRKALNNLLKNGLIEHAGRQYMLTQKVYTALKTEVEYTRDLVIDYIKAKRLILDYIDQTGEINNDKVQKLCGYTSRQARYTLSKLCEDDILVMIKQGPRTHYIVK